MLYSLLFFTTLLASHICLDVFDSAQCGHSKSCLRWSSCDFARCDFGFSWSMIKHDQKPYLEVEIIGQMKDKNNGFISLGFGEIDKMNDNGVVACRMQDGQFYISCGHNGNHFNQLFNSSELDSDLLVTSQGTLYGVEFDSTLSILRCRFLRLMSPTIQRDQLKDLNNGTKYYILSSKGVTNTPQKLSYHSVNRRVTSSMFDLSSSIRVNNIINENYLLVKLHAFFMILGWVLFATNGIIVAFFYKDNWSDKMLFRAKIWFQIHRLVQTMCVLSVLTAFILIFVHVGGYSTLGSLPYSAHPILGITATALMVINPIMALFRCKPEAKSRWIFNRLHFVVGISAYIIALSAMSIGIQLPPAGPMLPNMSAPWICVVIFLILIIMLFIYGMIRNRKKYNIIGSRDITLAASTNSDISNNPTESQEKSQLFRQSKIMSASYDILFGSVIISIIFFITLSVFVAVC